MIRHSVAFSLCCAPGSQEEKDFLLAADILGTIPEVKDFTKLREVSPKNRFQFVFSMKFCDEAAYAAYDANQDHLAFIQNHWQTEVAEFVEIDTVEL